MIRSGGVAGYCLWSLRVLGSVCGKEATTICKYVKTSPTFTSKTNSKGSNNCSVVISNKSTAMGTSSLSDVSNNTLLNMTGNTSLSRWRFLASTQLREYIDMKFLGTAKENLAAACE